MNLKVRLALMNFLEFAVWGAYLTSMGRYLGNIGIGPEIGLFYSMQGVVSIFMPALMGIVADRWVPAQRLLGFCHLVAGLFMFATAGYGLSVGGHAEFSIIFTLYSLSVAFYMPTLALTNSVAYSALTNAGMDTVKDFPPIRVFGTIGFILTMWLVDLLGFQSNQNQFVTSGSVSIILFLYTFTLPKCEVSRGTDKKSFVDAFGLRAFTLFRQKKMAIFFIFLYILLRFRNIGFSVGSIVGLVLDTTIVIGCFSLCYGWIGFSLEIDQTFIGAILTVIGYDINDTVVVYDRIRENLGKHKHNLAKADIQKIFNDSINQTLSRTINTSVSTLIVLVSIFILGGDSIRSFSFAMIIGIIIGTLSSIFIASPVAYLVLGKKIEKRSKELAEAPVEA